MRLIVVTDHFFTNDDGIAMKVLITGGGGFIGSHLVEYWQSRAEVIVLDNLRTGHRKNLSGLKCSFVEGSILDSDLVRQCCEGADYVFHLAALVSVPESMLKPAETAEVNVGGLLTVLEAARQAGVKKFCFASSAAVYGQDPAQPKVETMRPDPRSPYAVTKLDGEYYCDLYAREGWLPTASLRFFNVFGPRQDPQSAYAAAIPIFLRQALRGESITIYGDGGQTRDFVFVKDVVSALSFLAETAEANGVFNVGYGGSISIRAVAERIIQESGSSSQIEFAASRSGDLRDSQADASRLLAAGWRPSYSLDSGLELTVAASRSAANSEFTNTQSPAV